MEINNKILENILTSIIQLEDQHHPIDNESIPYQEKLILKILEMDNQGNYSQTALDHLMFLKNNNYIEFAGIKKTNDLTPNAILEDTDQRKIAIAAPLRTISPQSHCFLLELQKNAHEPD